MPRKRLNIGVVHEYRGRVMVPGKTYPVKEALKMLGAVYEADYRRWFIDPSRLNAASDIVRAVNVRGLVTIMIEPDQRVAELDLSRPPVCHCQEDLPLESRRDFEFTGNNSFRHFCGAGFTVVAVGANETAPTTAGWEPGERGLVRVRGRRSQSRKRRRERFLSRY